MLGILLISLRKLTPLLKKLNKKVKLSLKKKRSLLLKNLKLKRSLMLRREVKLKHLLKLAPYFLKNGKPLSNVILELERSPLVKYTPIVKSFTSNRLMSVKARTKSALLDLDFKSLLPWKK